MMFAPVGNEFRAKPFYDDKLDSVKVLFRDVRSKAVRLSRVLTLFVDADDAVVGVKINGVSELVR